MRFVTFFVLLMLTGNVSAGDKITHVQTGEDGIQRVEITGGSYFFDPDYIIVKKGMPVELIVKKNPGIVPHNIVMNEPGADIVFKKDISTDPEIIRFVPAQAGMYPFYCDKKLLFFKSHRQRGMEGIIEVTD